MHIEISNYYVSVDITLNTENKTKDTNFHQLVSVPKRYEALLTCLVSIQTHNCLAKALLSVTVNNQLVYS